MKRIRIITVVSVFAMLMATPVEVSAQDSGSLEPRSSWTSLAEVLKRGVGKSARRVHRIERTNTNVGLNLPQRTKLERNLEDFAALAAHRDTLLVKDDKTGKDMILMRAIKDDTTGEMVANETLDAAVVTARFRNVAERNGKVDLEFDITVPQSLYDSDWQLRFYPVLSMLGKDTDLDAVFVTGKNYRRQQLRGMERYQRFLDSIIKDPMLFIDIKNLERFLKRNIPQIYAFKSDTTFVSETQFESCFGVTERDAIAHYTSMHAINRNNRRIASKSRMYERYVKSPIVEEGVRLDTVMQNLAGDYVYSYSQTVRTSRDLKKADITLAGEIFEEARCLYVMPQSEPLTFYISSLSSFIDPSPKYLLSIIERRAEANMSYNVDFEAGKADILPELRNNASEIARIKDNLATLIRNEVFDLDSVTVTAYASPEGSVSLNNTLCGLRAASVSSYFGAFMKEYQDSLKASAGFSVNLDGTTSSDYKDVNVKFMSRIGGENWKGLTQEIELDDVTSDEDKEAFINLLSVADLDLRESTMQRSLKGYRDIRENLYPACRTVRFDFYLARKGMVKDTVHSTVLDTMYMRGVELMLDREYEQAITILRPYQDYNAAVAFTALDYNASAMSILADLPKSAQVDYLKAIIYARYNDDANAVKCFLDACAVDGTYMYRGNLDPEINRIIHDYNLDKELFDE